MEYTNLDETLLLTNLMMNVNRGIEELASLIMESEYEFMSEEDADEFYSFTIDFDFLHESFRRVESKYKDDKIIDMLDLDAIANSLDLIRHYLKDINKLF